MDPAHDPYAALRHRDYRRLLAGSVLTTIAGEMQKVAIGYELWERTRDARDLGLVGLVQFLPVFFLALPAGHAADRHSRKGLLLAALVLASLSSLGLAVLSYSNGRLPLLYACLLVAGVARALGMPARWALLPQVVPLHDLPNAITWNSSGWQIASVAGPALGGGSLLVAAYFNLPGRAALTYLLVASCSILAAVLIASLRPGPQGDPAKREDISLASLMAGLRFVFATKPILATITLDLFAVLLGGATALLPIFARDILHVGPAGLGALQAAPAVGALLMAIVLAHRPPLRRPGIAILWSVAGFGAATIVFGLSTNFLLSLAMLALIGAFDNVSVLVRGTLVQVLTPDAMRGRVLAVNAVFIGSSNELGAFESGETAKWFGPVGSVVGGGVGTILVVVAVMARWPQVLRLGVLGKPVAT
jgi:MFS family permease